LPFAEAIGADGSSAPAPDRSGSPAPDRLVLSGVDRTGRSATEPSGPLGADPSEPLGVGALLTAVGHAIAAVFPPARSVWVRGEVQRITEARSGHCYIDLVDPETAGEREAPVLKVNCWRSTWAPLRQEMARRGVELAEGMVVVLGGRVDLYAARAQVNLIVHALDIDALVGRLAAQRAALLQRLEAEDLLARNGRLVVPPVPLRIGVVGSPGTEGLSDFLGQLVGSGFAFRVGVVATAVQGAGAAEAVASAIGSFDPTDWDLVVVVRGGGARADLAVFDAEPVARAIATAPLPVWTGIGHTGDQSVADLVAHRSFVTPTACGQALVEVVHQWWSDRRAVAGSIARWGHALVQHRAQAASAVRSQLVAGARRQLAGHHARLVGRAGGLAARASHQVTTRQLRVASRAAALGPLARGAVAAADQRVVGWRQLLAAYDIEHQLRRGYTMTTDGQGRIVRGVHGLHAGDRLVTRFVDGSATSIVDGVSEVEQR
jgi:exodeoxyribonuclease VII large subunit